MQIKHGLIVDCNLHLIYFGIFTLTKRTNLGAFSRTLKKVTWRACRSFPALPTSCAILPFFNFDWFSALPASFVSIAESNYSVVTLVGNQKGFLPFESSGKTHSFYFITHCSVYVLLLMFSRWMRILFTFRKVTLTNTSFEFLYHPLPPLQFHIT